MFQVDFFWINRDQNSFEWFITLLDSLEREQDNAADTENKFLQFHLYITTALEKSDMRGLALQLAMDLLHKKVNLV